MNRKELGEEISVNLAIQGEIEGAKAQLNTLVSGKSEADAIFEKGVGAKKVSDKLAVEIKDASTNLEALEKELAESDSKLEAAHAKVPRLIKDDSPSPTHIKL